MSEVTFAKSFLATLDKRPIKLAADHVSDPRKHPNQSPFVLPRQSNPYPKKAGATSTQQAQEKTVTATLKPMRSGDAIVLSEVSLDSSIHDVKSQYAQKSGVAQDKVKLLLNKKPTADLKTLKELGVAGDVEFSVMIMGGAAVPPATAITEKAEPVPAANTVVDNMDIDVKAPAPESEKAQVEADTGTTHDQTATDMLRSDEFWTDLRGFLIQRLRNEQQGELLTTVFREAWSKR